MEKSILRVGSGEGRCRGKGARATAPSGRAGKYLESGNAVTVAGANKHIRLEGKDDPTTRLERVLESLA